MNQQPVNNIGAAKRQAATVTTGPATNNEHAVTTGPAKEPAVSVTTTGPATIDDHDMTAGLSGLGMQDPIKELNILILGETGVGKSTMINGFINYITYETLMEAEAGDIRTLIPSSFTVCDEDFEEVEVKTGTDKNEILRPGQSATQSSRVYSFPVGNATIRLIDVPGIGDTRGIDQDKENFENMLATISSLNELHGICILLKPNNSRLTVTFRFCIKELLKYLHRDASKNIVFCFTNSRGTFYRPGDTMKPLKALLNENQRSTDVEVKLNRHTVYCFDNEAYRFLAAVKNDPPVDFSDEERENFARSWEKSISETKRLLEYIQTLPPHSVQNTLNLNQARELVLKMVRPLAEISRNIQTNRTIVTDEKKQIEKTKESIKALKKKTMTTRTEIEVNLLDYPKTVCANRNCVAVWEMNGVNTTEYKTVCHHHCYVDGVQRDSVGDPKLMGCEAIDYRGFCSRANCGHNYREHLHIYYDSVQVVKQVENEAVKESIQNHLSAAEMKQKMIDEKDILIEEYEYELKEIEKASVTFAYFLKVNAITPYNDAMEMYLDHLIREEQDKIGAGAGSTTRKTLESLIRQKESYLYEKNILDRQMQLGQGSAPTPEEVERLVDKLKMLKHSGKNLKEALDCVNYAGRQVYLGATVTPRFPQNQTGTFVRTKPVQKSWFQRMFRF